MTNKTQRQGQGQRQGSMDIWRCRVEGVSHLYYSQTIQHCHYQSRNPIREEGERGEEREREREERGRRREREIEREREREREIEREREKGRERERGKGREKEEGGREGGRECDN